MRLKPAQLSVFRDMPRNQSSFSFGERGDRPLQRAIQRLTQTDRRMIPPRPGAGHYRTALSPVGDVFSPGSSVLVTQRWVGEAGEAGEAGDVRGSDTFLPFRDSVVAGASRGRRRSGSRTRAAAVRGPPSGRGKQSGDPEGDPAARRLLGRNGVRPSQSAYARQELIRLEARTGFVVPLKSIRRPEKASGRLRFRRTNKPSRSTSPRPLRPRRSRGRSGSSHDPSGRSRSSSH